MTAVFGYVLGSIISGTRLTKTGRYDGLLPTGGALMIGGAGALSAMTLTINYSAIFFILLVFGFSFGLIFPVTR